MTFTTGPAGRKRPRALDSFEVPHFGKLFVTGWLWSVCRWALGFLGAYIVSRRTGSPRLVQLTGSFMWAPLLFAGVIGGAVSDRFDRRNTLVAMFAVFAPLTLAVGLAALSDSLPVWVIYPFMAVVGVGWVLDMTVRRALIYDLVGPAQIDNAMAIEQFSSSTGLVFGALAGGTVIELVGIGQAYVAVAAISTVAMVVLMRVPRPRATVAVSGPSFLNAVVEGFRALRGRPTLVSILGVTFIVNFFHFAYFPIVPLVAERVDAGAFLTGLLAAATGIGMAIGAAWVASVRPRRGRAYVLGALGGFVLLLGFALFRSYAPVFLFLLLASVSVGLFASTQSALVLSVADADLRGRAMGLLSMAIGGLPIGMYVLGEVAERAGAPAALVASNLVGLTALGLFLWRRPEAVRVD